jgi:hypothetical protein
VVVVVVFVVSDSLTKEALSSVIELKGERAHEGSDTKRYHSCKKSEMMTMRTWRRVANSR